WLWPGRVPRSGVDLKHVALPALCVYAVAAGGSVEVLVAVATRGTSSNYLQRAPSPSGLVDVVDLILDKGLVIDAYVRVSVVGIELVTVDARIVVASVDTYLRFAEAVNRLDLTETEMAGLAELQETGAKRWQSTRSKRRRRSRSVL